MWSSLSSIQHFSIKHIIYHLKCAFFLFINKCYHEIITDLKSTLKTRVAQPCLPEPGLEPGFYNKDKHI